MTGDASKELNPAPIPAPQGDGLDTEEVGFERAKSLAVGTARYIANQFRILARTERLKLVGAFRTGLIPRRAPGRKRRKEITAAYEDWKHGLKGLPLYRKHIPRFDKLALWRRREKGRALMDAIRTRQRRERKRGKSGDTRITKFGPPSPQVEL